MKLPLSIFTVQGSSMEPTLKPGQKIISLNWLISPKKGDLVAVENGGRLMVKRVEKINGKSVYVVGDNQKMSTDSREFGWVKTNKIIGKIIFVLD